jgi:hypothetical protein
MNKKQALYFLVVIHIIILACDLNLKGTNKKIIQASYDTVRFDNINDTDKICKSLAKSFYKRFGIIISNYYIVMDSLAVDLNRDSFMDTIIILSPIPLEPVYENYNCNFENQPKRLLIEIINDGGKSKIRNVYSDLVTDVGGVLSHYNGIFKTKDGFKIVHQSGAKYSWLYTVEFSTATKNKLTLIKISKNCSFEGEGRNLDYNFNNQTIERINIPDTLQSNCNCDKYWLELEMK